MKTNNISTWAALLTVSGLLLTTEAIVTDASEKEKAPAMPPGGGGMGGMDY